MESHNENQLLPSPANAPSGSSHPRDHSQQAGDAIHEHDPRSSPRSAPGHMLQSERTPTPLTSLAGFHQHTDEETHVAPSPYTAEIREIIQTELREARAAHVADMASLRRNMEEQFNQFMEKRFSQMTSSSSRGKQVQETTESPLPEYYTTPSTRLPSEAGGADTPSDLLEGLVIYTPRNHSSELISEHKRHPTRRQPKQVPSLPSI